VLVLWGKVTEGHCETARLGGRAGSCEPRRRGKARRETRRESEEGREDRRDWKGKIEMTRMWRREMVTGFVTEERVRQIPVRRWARSGAGRTERESEREQKKVQEGWGEEKRG